MRCLTCGRLTDTRCTHPITEPWIVFPDEVRGGDLIEHSLTLEFHRCEKVERIPAADGSQTGGPWSTYTNSLPERVALHLRVGRSIRVQTHWPSMPLLRMQTGPCGRAACERHMREFGDGDYQCAAHWDLSVFSGA
jgi:hypothetical protein